MLEKLRFKKKMFGGYSKKSVKEQVKKLDAEYKKMFDEECENHKKQLAKKQKEIDSLKK